MELWLITFIVIIITSFMTGLAKNLLEIESSYTLKSLIYEVFVNLRDVVVGYFILSALAGHYLA